MKEETREKKREKKKSCTRTIDGMNEYTNTIIPSESAEEK